MQKKKIYLTHYPTRPMYLPTKEYEFFFINFTPTKAHVVHRTSAEPDIKYLPRYLHVIFVLAPCPLISKFDDPEMFVYYLYLKRYQILNVFIRP